jgi:hypothetical protein
MKKLLFSVFALSFAISVKAQCTPDGTLIPDAFGVYPDTTQNFAIAEVGTPYSQVLHFKAPSDAGDIDEAYAGQTIESFTVMSVDNMPPGLSYACNISSCQYPGGSTGCAAITGTPTTTGTYEMVINIRAVVLAEILPGFPPVPVTVDESFGGYRIHVVEAGTASIEPNIKPELLVYPNPAQEVLTIDNLNQFSNVGAIRVVNVEGKLIQAVAYNGDASMTLNTEALVSGVYFVEIAHADGIERVKFMKK